MGSFAIQDETTDSIAEAMSVLKSWNPQWQPRCFMIDNCDEEISALRQNFQCKDVNVVLMKRGKGLSFSMFLLDNFRYFLYLYIFALPRKYALSLYFISCFNCYRLLNIFVQFSS